MYVLTYLAQKQFSIDLASSGMFCLIGTYGYLLCHGEGRRMFTLFSILLCHLLFYSIVSYPILSYAMLIVLYSIMSSSILFYSILSCSILSYAMLIVLYSIMSSSILFYSIVSYPVLSYAMLSSFIR